MSEVERSEKLSEFTIIQKSDSGETSWEDTRAIKEDPQVNSLVRRSDKTDKTCTMRVQGVG